VLAVPPVRTEAGVGAAADQPAWSESPELEQWLETAP